MMPEAIGHHAGRERVVGRGDLRGEFETAAAGGGEGLGIEDLEVASRDRRRGLFVVAADVERLIEAVCFEQARRPARGGELGFQLTVFGGEGGELG